MGTSESKMVVAATPKPEPSRRLKHHRVAELSDPRSPTTGVNRTPIRMDCETADSPAVVESARPVCFEDPRSPTVGVVRTPMKDSVKVTVSSLARRLSTLFLSDPAVSNPSAPLPKVTFTKQPSLQTVEQQQEEDETSATMPLLPPGNTQDMHSLTGVTNAQSTPTHHVLPTNYGSITSSPFVVVGEVEVEVEREVEEEADDALLISDSPLKKRELSLSLLTCHDGVNPSQILSSSSSPAEERPLSPVPPAAEDHSYALPTTEPCSADPVAALTPEGSPVAARSPEVRGDVPATEEQPGHPEEPKPAPSEPLPTANAPSPVLPPPTGFRCPTLHVHSPSQAVFKPQWLGIGFGPTGVRVRAGGQKGRGKAGGHASPLSSRKPGRCENNGVLAKPKTKGKSPVEGRSPLQILRETNSPRDHTSQMKLRISTPEKRRFGQIDRRILSVSQNKEN